MFFISDDKPYDLDTINKKIEMECKFIKSSDVSPKNKVIVSKPLKKDCKIVVKPKARGYPFD